jgi:hypothetical protein
MAQISRPFQVALVAVVLLAGVWLFALQGRSTTSTTGTSAPTAKAPATHTNTHARTAAASRAAASRAAHARSGAAAHERAHAAGTAHRASAPSAPRHASATHASRAAASPRATTHTSTTTHTSAATTHAGSGSTAAARTAPATTAPHKSSPLTTPAGQRAVEAQLAKGDVVLLLFWNPRGAEDTLVHGAVAQVQAAARGAHQLLAVHEAAAAQVGEFGSVTRGVQVYATPTIVIVNPHAQATVLTGLQDAFSIEQAIAEARRPQPRA